MSETNKKVYPYLFIAPFFITFLVFNLYPSLYTLILSFTKYDGFGNPVFSGIANYKRLATDIYFYRSIGNTITMWLLAMIPQLIIATFLAVIFTRFKVRASHLIKSVFYFPNLVNAVAVSVLFQLLFNFKGGTINMLLTLIGLPAIHWLTTPFLAQLLVSTISIWMWFGYDMIIILAAMTAIDNSYYEAADIDGASTFQSFRYITLPMLKPAIFYLIMISTIGAMQSFEIPQVLFNGPGPNGSVRTIVVYMFTHSFNYGHLGYGATISYALFGLILAMSFPTMKKSIEKERKKWGKK